MSKQYDYQEEEGEIFCREDQFLGEDLELMKKFQTSYPNQFHLHLLNINIKDHIEIQDGVKTTQEPEPKIFWNSNALIPA